MSSILAIQFPDFQVSIPPQSFLEFNWAEWWQRTVLKADEFSERLGDHERQIAFWQAIVLEKAILTQPHLSIREKEALDNSFAHISSHAWIRINELNLSLKNGLPNKGMQIRSFSAVWKGSEPTLVKLFHELHDRGFVKPISTSSAALNGTRILDARMERVWCGTLIDMAGLLWALIHGEYVREESVDDAIASLFTSYRYKDKKPSELNVKVVSKARQTFKYTSRPPSGRMHRVISALSSKT